MPQPAEFQGSPANADFLKAIGLDPDVISADPLVFEILDANHVIVRYQGFKTITADLLEDAFGLLAHRALHPSD